MSRYILTDGLDNFVSFYTDAKLKKDNPNTSFPAVLTDAIRATFNMYPCTTLPQPIYDPATQKIELNAVPVLNTGNWELGWTVSALTQQEIDYRTVVNGEQNFFDNADNAYKLKEGLRNPDLRHALGIIYSEAKAYEANNSIATPGIQKLADTWGVTRGQAITRVINKYGPYIPAITEAFALREDEIDPQP